MKLDIGVEKLAGNDPFMWVFHCGFLNSSHLIKHIHERSQEKGKATGFCRSNICRPREEVVNEDLIVLGRLHLPIQKRCLKRDTPATILGTVEYAGAYRQGVDKGEI